jgi:class 3 adenylate cyclase/tetratricopeptide (TPR) repeat protein
LSAAATRCPTCGEPVVQPERKLVTVLFADLSGYTALAEVLDPEDVYGAVRPWITGLRLIVEDHGGTVPQVMGDGFMAVFGVPAAHEDDAERAVRAALALVAHAAELDADPSGVRFPGLHIGVNSGEVIVVGSREASGFAVVGDAVNVSARLADLATAGRVEVGEATRVLTARAVRYGPRRLLAAKGKRQPIASYEALAVRPPGPSARRNPPLNAPFVDRVAALRRLAAEAHATATAGRTRVRVIIDEPGVGKTRLAEELHQRLPGFIYLYGACHPYGQRLPLAALAQAIGAQIGIVPGAPQADARRRIRRFVRLAPVETARPLLAGQLETVLGVHGGEASEGATRAARPGGVAVDASAAVRPVLRAVTEGRPAIIVLDDVHWADPDLIALLERIQHEPWAEPFLFLALARAEPVEWYRDLPVLRLGGLALRDARRIVGALAGPGLPRTVMERLIERAAGNPLFLEESARMLIESGVLARTARGWQVTDATAIERVPATLRLLVAARLDNLPPVAKRLLQLASVAGLFTWDDLLERLAATSVETDDGASLRAALRLLEERDLLRRRAVSRIPETVELDFKHVVIRDVAYESLPRGERARCHRATADWLRERVADGRAVAAIAHGYEQAWELSRAAARPDRDPLLAAEAAEYLRRWGDDVFTVQPRLAEALYERGLRIAVAAPDAIGAEVVAQLLVGRAESLGELGRQREAIEAAQTARGLAESSGATETRAFALLALGRARSDLGEVQSARTLVAEALELFETSGNALGQARGQHRLAEANRFDDFPTQVRCYRRAYALYGRARARPEQAIVAEDLAYLLTLVGGPEFVRWFARAERLAGTGDERGRAALGRAWAYAAWYRGDLDGALRAAQEARPAAASAGDRWIEVDTILIEALVRSVAGTPAEAEVRVHELVRIARGVGARHLEAVALLAGARPAVRSGRPLQATRRLQAARRTMRELGVTMELAEVDLAEAAVLLERGAWDQVADPATAGERRALANGWQLLVPLGPLLRGRAHLGAGRFKAARRELIRARRLAASLEASGPLAIAEASLAQVAQLTRPAMGGTTTVASADRPGHIMLAAREPAAIGMETDGLRALQRGDSVAAAISFGAAIRLWHELGLTVWQARAEGFRSTALELAGRTSAARAAQQRSAAILAAIGSPAARRLHGAPRGGLAVVHGPGHASANEPKMAQP